MSIPAMKNWKTTLVGLAGAFYVSLEPWVTQGQTPSRDQLVFASVMALLGWLSADGGSKK